MTAVAAAFIRSNARRSFGFLKPYLFDSLLGMSTILSNRRLNEQTSGSHGRLYGQQCMWTKAVHPVSHNPLRTRTWNWPW